MSCRVYIFLRLYREPCCEWSGPSHVFRWLANHDQAPTSNFRWMTLGSRDRCYSQLTRSSASPKQIVEEAILPACSFEIALRKADEPLPRDASPLQVHPAACPLSNPAIAQACPPAFPGSASLSEKCMQRCSSLYTLHTSAAVRLRLPHQQ